MSAQTICIFAVCVGLHTKLEKVSENVVLGITIKELKNLGPWETFLTSLLIVCLVTERLENITMKLRKKGG